MPFVVGGCQGQDAPQAPGAGFSSVSTTILTTAIRISYCKNVMTLFTIHGGSACVGFVWLF